MVVVVVVGMVVGMVVVVEGMVGLGRQRRRCPSRLVVVGTLARIAR